MLLVSKLHLIFVKYTLSNEDNSHIRQKDNNQGKARVSISFNLTKNANNYDYNTSIGT